MIYLFWISIGLLVYSYALYPLLLAIVARKEKSVVDSNATPSITVLLSVFNEEKHLAARIANLLALDYPADKLEVLIGSDGSDDRTNEIGAACRDPRIKFIAFTPRQGKPSVLNRLVPQTRGDLLVFTDANAMFAPDALRQLVRHFTDTGIGGVGGEIVFHHRDGGSTDENIYWRLETFLRRREPMWDSCLGATGAIYAIRCELWPSIPDNTLIDDFVIPMRVREQGHRFIYERNAVATMRLPPTVGDEMTRRIRIGAGGFQALGLCWRSLLPWRGRYVWAFWSHKVLRWLGPFFMLGALVANFALVPRPFFLVTLVLQLTFYALAVAGNLIRWPLFRVPHYFVSINVALLFGFFRFITGTQRAAWKRTAR